MRSNRRHLIVAEPGDAAVKICSVRWLNLPPNVARFAPAPMSGRIYAHRDVAAPAAAQSPTTRSRERQTHHTLHPMLLSDSGHRWYSVQMIHVANQLLQMIVAQIADTDQCHTAGCRRRMEARDRGRISIPIMIDRHRRNANRRHEKRCGEPEMRDRRPRPCCRLTVRRNRCNFMTSMIGPRRREDSAYQLQLQRARLTEFDVP